MNKSVSFKAAGAFLLAAFVLGTGSMLQAPRLYAAPKPETVSQAEPAKLININKAGKEELDSLRGVGPSLAERIVKYRDEHGPFKQVDDLVNVNGIGGAKLQKIKGQVTV